MNLLPKILGQIEGAATGALSIYDAVSGKAETHAPDDVVAIHAPTDELKEQLANYVEALAPGGDKRKALADLYPDLEAKYLDVGLQLATDLTVALRNDGVVDTAEKYKIAINVVRGMLR